eukprot:m.40888 g.40888  ORF g.40888 m.40888 type:complete len:184 (-) comp10480_c0_seq1:28-579(-)
MSTWTSSFVEGVPFIPTSITHVQCEDLDVMVPFALKVMPEWTAGNVSVRRMTDGITNIVVKISHLQEAFVIRIYGNRTDVFLLTPFQQPYRIYSCRISMSHLSLSNTIHFCLTINRLVQEPHVTCEQPRVKCKMYPTHPLILVSASLRLHHTTLPHCYLIIIIIFIILLFSWTRHIATPFFGF